MICPRCKLKADKLYIEFPRSPGARNQVACLMCFWHTARYGDEPALFDGEEIPPPVEEKQACKTEP
jgi:hypothetical protein